MIQKLYCCISSQKSTHTILSVNCQAFLLWQHSIQVRRCSLLLLRSLFQVYDLQKEAQLVKKLESGLREISSISIHPGGDNVIVGSKDGKLCWFDTDLSTRPYKTLKTHSKDITSVMFHRKYPLFASSSKDCTAYVCHGMVYSDLNQNPLIVPLEILRGHSSSDGRGMHGIGSLIFTLLI